MKIGIGSWFSFESEAEKKRKLDRFEETVYPLGRVAQKEWELSVLRELFPRQRSVREEHFQLLVLRESMIKSAADHPEAEIPYRNGAIRAWYDKKTLRALPDEKKKILIAVAVCENDAKTLEDLPTAENIRSLVGMIPF